MFTRGKYTKYPQAVSEFGDMWLNLLNCFEQDMLVIYYLYNVSHMQCRVSTEKGMADQYVFDRNSSSKHWVGSVDV